MVVITIATVLIPVHPRGHVAGYANVVGVRPLTAGEISWERERPVVRLFIASPPTIPTPSCPAAT